MDNLSIPKTVKKDDLPTDLGITLAHINGDNNMIKYASYIYTNIERKPNMLNFHIDLYSSMKNELEKMKDKDYFNISQAMIKSYYDKKSNDRDEYIKLGKKAKEMVDEEDMAVLIFIYQKNISDIFDIIFYLEGYRS